MIEKLSPCHCLLKLFRGDDEGALAACDEHRLFARMTRNGLEVSRKPFPLTPVRVVPATPEQLAAKHRRTRGKL
jgi:hypothetical protein